jgi:2,4-dienoyl-CoA reductase-like NADH-dependent reductase (Old Yellow Enzyme family)/thioredoxin reductase
MSLTRIWQPIKLGQTEIKNRVVRAANSTTMFPNSVNEDFVAYHAARARAGVGLSILEAGSVHPNSRIAYMIDDNAVEGFKKLMDAVGPHDMKVFQQLWHGGHNLPGALGNMPWAPSATPSPLTGIVGVPMGQAEIDELVAAFATAARRCREAGLNGVEIHGGHGYVVQQFLSPLTNVREDEYNGDLLDRARFLVEILQAVRTEVGSDFTVGVRMSSSSAKGGTSPEDVATVANHLTDLGLIDFLDISYSDYFDMAGMAFTMAHPSGYQLPINEAIARTVRRVPRIVTGRYRTLEEAEQVLREDQGDLVSLVRAHIADPELVRKTREGRVEDVRPCIACNQGCIAGLLQIGRMQCTVNPAAGYEVTLDESLITREELPRRILIVGGGPAGMEAARICALRGHSVILAEASPHLGGALQIAKRAPNLHILEDLILWLERQIYQLGVEVRLNTYMEAADILAEAADAVIIATGGIHTGDGRQAVMPGELPGGMDLAHVYDPVSLIASSGKDFSGKTALVFDDVGRYDAIAAAEYLQQGGADILFVTSHGSFAPRMLGSSRDIESFKRLSKGKFALRINTNLKGIELDTAEIRARGAEANETVPADVVVVVTSQVPVRALYDELRDHLEAIHLVGDALSPRDLLAAMHDGHRCARVI